MDSLASRCVFASVGTPPPFPSSPARAQGCGRRNNLRAGNLRAAAFASACADRTRLATRDLSLQGIKSKIELFSFFIVISHLFCRRQFDEEEFP